MRRAIGAFSAIEVVVAAAILGAVLVPVVGVILRVSDKLVDRSSERIALLLSQSMVETLRQKKWDENTVDPYALATPSAIGLDSGEALPNMNLDDIDDYNGYSDAPCPGYLREVTVTYASAVFGGDILPSASATNFKLITVKTTKTGPVPISSGVETLFCNGIVN